MCGGLLRASYSVQTLSSLHFNTVVTGAAPRDNAAPPDLAASAPQRHTHTLTHTHKLGNCEQTQKETF